jgi:hypothetical protein
MDSPNYQLQRKFGIGLRICVPGDRSQFTFPGQGYGLLQYPVLGKEQDSGNARSTLHRMRLIESNRAGLRPFHMAVRPCQIRSLLDIQGRVGQFCLTFSIDNLVSIDRGLMKD